MEIYRITGRGLIRCPFKASRVLDLLPKGQWTVEHGPGPPNYCSIKGLHRTVLLTFLDMACWISYMHTVQSANIAHLYEHIIERQRAWLLGAASPDCLSPPRLYTLTGGGGEDGRQIWDEKKGGNERRDLKWCKCWCCSVKHRIFGQFDQSFHLFPQIFQSFGQFKDSREIS